MRSKELNLNFEETGAEIEMEVVEKNTLMNFIFAYVRSQMPERIERGTIIKLISQMYQIHLNLLLNNKKNVSAQNKFFFFVKWKFVKWNLRNGITFLMKVC